MKSVSKEKPMIVPVKTVLGKKYCTSPSIAAIVGNTKKINRNDFLTRFLSKIPNKTTFKIAMIKNKTPTAFRGPAW